MLATVAIILTLFAIIGLIIFFGGDDAVDLVLDFLSLLVFWEE